MLFYAVKIVLTTLIIVLISEISKRNTFIGALLASLPLTSLLAIIWIYIETKKTHAIESLSSQIFWLVLPSLLFFLTLPFFLKARIPFLISLLLSASLTVGGYFIMLFFLKKIQ
ncbi:MAG TPA: DUF3147 family protein [Firmicutes bacterium]|nr:DUF3147 family protein [Bacillota bacterium]